jgi:hypothetical protein
MNKHDSFTPQDPYYTVYSQGRKWLSKTGGASSNAVAMVARRRCRRRLLFCQKVGGNCPPCPLSSYAPVKYRHTAALLELVSGSFLWERCPAWQMLLPLWCVLLRSIRKNNWAKGKLLTMSNQSNVLQPIMYLIHPLKIIFLNNLLTLMTLLAGAILLNVLFQKIPKISI